MRDSRKLPKRSVGVGLATIGLNNYHDYFKGFLIIPILSIALTLNNLPF